jgi:phage replication-related protein YjqB (UPF0714/DUF867 family)
VVGLFVMLDRCGKSQGDNKWEAKIVMDKYPCFKELSQSEQDGSFVICTQEGSTGVAILAPHGGGIEPGTSELAKAVAGMEHTYYCFEGRKRSGNQDLHITSTNFDEPEGLRIAKQSERIVTIHGCAERQAIVYLGGLDVELKNKVSDCLIEAGFQTSEHFDPNLLGRYRNNICNQSKNGCGVQLEISKGLRNLMFENLSSRNGRERRMPPFDKFVLAVRQAIWRTVA